MVAISDTLWESLPCLRSSEGLRVIMTNTESMEIMDTTTNNSIKVNEDLPASRQGSMRVKDLRSFMYIELLWVLSRVMVA